MSMTRDEIAFRSRFALPTPTSTFEAESGQAREVAECLGLLSLEFSLRQVAAATVVRVTNRRSGQAREYPRRAWVSALRDELHAGLLGRSCPARASMQRSLTLAREAASRPAARSAGIAGASRRRALPAAAIVESLEAGSPRAAGEPR